MSIVQTNVHVFFIYVHICTYMYLPGTARVLEDTCILCKLYKGYWDYACNYVSQVAPEAEGRGDDRHAAEAAADTEEERPREPLPDLQDHEPFSTKRGHMSIYIYIHV